MNHFLQPPTLNKLLFHFVAALVVLATFSSCEKSNGTIGAGKFTNDRPELGERLTFPVVSYTVPWDSISTKSPSKVVLGNLIDPVFGRTESAFATRFLLSKTSPDFGEGTVCDSVKLRLAYSGYYGIPGDEIHVQVNALTEPLIDTAAYYSNHTSVLGAVVADTIVALDPFARLFNGVDSLVGYLSFDMDPSFFQSVLFDPAIAGADYLADNESFVAEVPGLHFSDIGPGGDVAGYFNLSNPGSMIELYYHTGEEDSVPKVFNLTFGQNFGDPVGSYNVYKNDHSTAQFDLDMMDTVNGEVLTYVQGGSGVRTILEFPGLDTLIGKNYSINRATLVADVLQGTVGPYTLPNTLLLLQDLDSAQQLIKDYSSSVNATGGSVVRADIREYRYKFNVTRMVHDFVNERGEVLPLIVAPSASSGNLYRAVLGGGMHPSIPMEFNVYYTKSE